MRDKYEAFVIRVFGQSFIPDDLARKPSGEYVSDLIQYGWEAFEEASV